MAPEVGLESTILQLTVHGVKAGAPIFSAASRGAHRRIRSPCGAQLDQILHQAGSARAVGKPARFDISYLLNGLMDRYLYSRGYLDTALPFDELCQQSRINDASQAAGNSPDFSNLIHASSPSRFQ